MAFLDLLTLLRMQTEIGGSSIALETEVGKHISYAQLLAHVETNAAKISGLSGKARPRVGIVLPNGTAMAVTLLSAACAGTAIPFNPAYRLPELKSYFNQTGIDLLLTAGGGQNQAAAAADAIGVPVHPVTDEGLVEVGDDNTAHLQEPAPDDVALVLLTSGSTGKPKAVPLSHTNVVTSAGDVGRSMQLGPSDRCLAMWEQYHVGGLVDLLMAPLASGGTVICTDGFDAQAFFRMLETVKPSWFQGVPTTLNELVAHARRNKINPANSTLRLIRSVAAPLSPKLMAEVHGLFKRPVIQTYGMTEAGPLITSTSLAPGGQKPGSVGRSCGCEIRVTDAKGNTLATGEQGPLSIRGPNVFSGYEDDVEANSQQFLDGWFFTGDIGYFDQEGDLVISGRTKQLINRGGEKVNPQEVDDIMLEHPAVSEAASFAVKHPTLGETVSAAIVLRDGAKATEQELKDFFSTHLASFKVPGRVHFLDEMPRNPIGKIDRLVLSERSASQGPERIAPRDRVEQFIAGLWLAELDLDEVGIDDDFGTSGGDSFSLVRIVSGLEKTFGVPIGDSDAEVLNTIRSQAEFLRSGAPGSKPSVREQYLVGRLEAVDIDGIVGQFDDDMLAFSQDGDAGLVALAGSRTGKAYDVAADAALVYATPREIASYLEKPGGLPMPGAVNWFSSPRQMASIFLRKSKLERNIRAELKNADRAGGWQRHVLQDHALFYTDGQTPSDKKRLIVGFCGNAMRLMIPTYRILMNLDPERFDLMLLRDPSRNHYKNGVPGLGGNIEQIAATLQAYSTGYEKVVSFGVSAGGLAAILVCDRNNWHKAVAIGADSPNRHSRFSSLVGDIDTSADVVLYHASGNVRDVQAVEEITVSIPSAVAVAIPDFANHNVLHEYYQLGRLGQFMDEAIG